MNLHEMRKHAFIVAVCLVLLLTGLTGISASASAESSPAEPVLPGPTVSVTVADANGTLVLANEEISLRDADGDGVLTVYDALVCSGEQQGKDLFATGQWGEQTGDYGCYINHRAVESLTDAVEDGDLLYAFVRTDASVAYCYFDASRASVAGEKTLTLTLQAVNCDADGNSSVSPVADAVIQIDGKDTAFSTDEEGKVTLQFDGSGSCIVSARKDGVALVPPVCAVAVSGEDPAAGDRSSFFGWSALSAAAIAMMAAVVHRRNRRADTL